ncbi:MAG: VOC family protein [Alphaproteobacteria bacterium]|nr:VOC family protein [Alphaproteobacteria bacterium]
MARAISGIDHAIVGVRDLEAARLAYARLGFQATPRGRHYGWGTANYCLMFARDYVELLGIVDPAQFTNNLDAFLAGGEGLLGLAFATPDAGEAGRILAARGVEASGPHELARAIEIGDEKGEEGRLEFALVRPAAAAAPGLNAFLCEHRTPGLLRRADWLAHRNTARGIVGVTVVVDDPPAMAPVYERLLGDGSTTLTDDTLAVHTGGAAIVFARVDDLSLLHPEVDIPDRAMPRLVALRIAIEDRGAALEALAAGGVEPAGLRRDAIVVAPEDACGVVLELVGV